MPVLHVKVSSELTFEKFYFTGVVARGAAVSIGRMGGWEAGVRERGV